jgi:hypothetical protein
MIGLTGFPPRLTYGETNASPNSGSGVHEWIKETPTIKLMLSQMTCKIHEFFWSLTHPGF